MNILFFKRYGESENNILSNIGWATFGKIVKILTEILVGIFVARYLGPSQYGLMNYVISFVTIFNIFATFGLENIEIRELARGIIKRDEILGTSFILRTFFASIAILFIIITLFISKSDSKTSILILIYSISILSSSLNVIRSYFTSIISNRYIVITEMIRYLIGAFIKIVLLFQNASLIYFIIALTFDSVLIAIGYITAYRKKVSKTSQWVFNKSLSKELIKESFPLLLSGGAVIIYQRIDQVMIKNMIDNASLGYFSVAAKFSEFILFVPLVISQTVAPALVNKLKINEISYNLKKQEFIDITLWISIIISTIVSLSSYYLIRFTYGNEYILSVPVLQIISFKTVGMALSNTTGQLIIIEGIQKWAIVRNIIGLIACILFNFILIPQFGITGSAWATIITVIFSGFISNFLIPTYRHLFMIQLNSIIYGLPRLINKYLYAKH